MAQRKSIVPPAMVEGLRGSLVHTSITDLLQFLSVAHKTGALTLEKLPERTAGQVYFANGDMVHAMAGASVGIEALAELCGWTDGGFHFLDGVASPKTSVTLPAANALLEAVRMHDERQRFKKDPEPSERRGEMQPSSTARSTTDVLDDFLKIPGVVSAVIVGRDGFLIESVGGSSSVALDDLCAALAHAINSVEEMGTELQIAKFQDLFVEYGRAVIMCRPIGDAIMAVVAPDATKLGIIRHKAKPLADELSRFF